MSDPQGIEDHFWLELRMIDPKAVTVTVLGQPDVSQTVQALLLVAY